MRRNSKLFIFDTNIWISYIISKKFEHIIDIINKNKLIVFVNKELLLEIETTLNKPKFKKYISKETIKEAITLIKKVIFIKNNRNKVTVCRDPKDDFILALCESINANYLVTGDDDLLILKNYKKTKIISLTDFKRMF